MGIYLYDGFFIEKNTVDDFQNLLNNLNIHFSNFDRFGNMIRFDEKIPDTYLENKIKEKPVKLFESWNELVEAFYKEHEMFIRKINEKLYL